MTVAEHGSRRSYQLGCRCVRCRAANAAYVRDWRLAVLFPDPGEAVDATAARAHLVSVQRMGVGYRQAASLAGLAAQLVLEIRAGVRTQIRADTATRILGMRSVLAHGQLVKGWRTWRYLDSLLGEGFTQGEIARRLGLHPSKLQVEHRQVRVRTALRVKRLWHLIMAEDGASLVVDETGIHTVSE